MKQHLIIIGISILGGILMGQIFLLIMEWLKS